MAGDCTEDDKVLSEPLLNPSVNNQIEPDLWVQTTSPEHEKPNTVTVKEGKRSFWKWVVTRVGGAILFTIISFMVIYYITCSLRHQVDTQAQTARHAADVELAEISIMAKYHVTPTIHPVEHYTRRIEPTVTRVTITQTPAPDAASFITHVGGMAIEAGGL